MFDCFHHKSIFQFYFTYQHWGGSSSWNISWGGSNNWIHLSYIVNGCWCSGEENARPISIHDIELVIHYLDVIISAMASQIVGVSIVCSTVCSGADQRNHQSSALVAFVMGIHHWPSQRARNAENVSIWWRRHVLEFSRFIFSMHSV